MLEVLYDNEEPIALSLNGVNILSNDNYTEFSLDKDLVIIRYDAFDGEEILKKIDNTFSDFPSNIKLYILIDDIDFEPRWSESAWYIEIKKTDIFLNINVGFRVIMLNIFQKKAMLFIEQEKFFMS